MEEKVILAEMSQKDKAYKIGGLILGVFLIYSFIIDLHWGKLFMGIIFVLVSGYSKEMIMKEDGIEYTYRYFFFKRYDKLAFENLDEVVVIKSRGKYLVYFVQGQTSEKRQMLEEKVDELLEFIKKHSKVKIRIEDLD